MELGVYQRMYDAQDSFWWHKGMRRFFSLFLNAYVGGTDNVILDLGCGTGALFAALRPYGAIYGIDIAEEAVRYARKQGMAREVISGNAIALPFAPDTFAVVVCSDLLYHAQVSDERAVISEIHRVLKPHGVVVIKEAAYDWLRSRMDELVHTKHRFTAPELKDDLLAAHFHVCRITYIMTILFPLALAARLFERIFRQKYDPSRIFTTGTALNTLFTLLLYGEASLTQKMNFPFGLSIIAVAKKP